MKKIFVILFLLNLRIPLLLAQIEIHVSEMKLNEVLLELRETFDFEFSYHDAALARYTVSADKTFDTKEEAVRFLLKGLPLGYELKGDVFLIFPKPAEEPKPKVYIFSGRVLSRETREVLPFSHLLINQQQLTGNQNGYFSYSSQTDSVFRFKASHLGYGLYDTVMPACSNCNFYLTAQSAELEEVMVKANLLEHAAITGTRAGLTKINHVMADFLPGQSDNTIYNLLRMQPGVLAAGEQSENLILWGSGEGLTQVYFDRMPLWELKNFHDHIGIVNPLLVKNMEIFKGGYDAGRQDKTGGIVAISGKDGVPTKLRADFTLSNLIANGMLEMPVTENSSLKAAVRKTYYNLYKEEDTFVARGRSGNGGFDFLVTPQYDFGDVNLKYAGTNKQNDRYFISAFYARDEFLYNMIHEDRRLSIERENRETKKRYGVSSGYEKIWHNGAGTEVNVYHSALEADYALRSVGSSGRSGNGNRQQIQNTSDSRNEIVETGAEAVHHFPFYKKNQFNLGIKFVYNESLLTEDSLQINLAGLAFESRRLALFAQDMIRLNRRISVHPGVRINYSLSIGKVYFAPRISLTALLSEHWKINGAIGRYHQFVSKSVVTDESGGFHYIVTCSDAESIPVLEAFHAAGNLAFSNRGIQGNMEIYYKKTRGITGYYRTRLVETVYEGENRSYGIEFFLKKDIKRHALWVTYNLGKAQELFPSPDQTEYGRAPYDQRHEVKLAGILNFSKWYFSASYVYGSGLPVYRGINTIEADEPAYHRLDASMARKFRKKRVKGEAGISVLNVTNHENLRFTGSVNIPEENTFAEANFYTEPVPRTITVFLKLSL